MLAVETQRPADDVAELARPPGASRTVNLGGVGQVTNLVTEAELVLRGRRSELGWEGVRAPDRGPGVPEEALDHVGPSARCDDVVARGRGLQHPVPPVPPVHPHPSLIRVDHRTRPRRLPDGVHLGLGTGCQPREGGGDGALTDAEPEDAAADRYQPLMGEVVAVGQVAEQRLDPRPEGAPRFHPWRGLADRPLAAVRAAGGIDPAFDHDRPQLRQFDHLAAADPPLPSLRERRCAAPTGRWTTAHDHVRGGSLAAEPQVSLLRAALLPPSFGPIRLVPRRRRDRRVPGTLRGPPDPGLQLGHPLVQTDDQVDQRVLVQRGQFVTVHQVRELTRTLASIGE
jgi:hypothetical protein